ncbi:hypothetical protein ODE01S_02230 [Oceanithermus desulfurans NBRC 100063]|uniref:Uncharacterized protein n=1 Tax=Oceanithermus desulfurans NBRC 100063 TaxID=1227550 RepID=A0A511RGL2_9DEIN|nr:hypothetical protein ODE01S_02230 [Oceanithermus desulfurans NBRC 100063]
MRSVRSATCTSVEPVSPGNWANFSMIACFSAVVSAIVSSVRPGSAAALPASKQTPAYTPRRRLSNRARRSQPKTAPYGAVLGVWKTVHHKRMPGAGTM